MQKELLTKKNYAAIGEEISHELAVDFVHAFRTNFPTEQPGFTVGRDIIDQILAQPGCVGIRLYNAINEEGQKTMVYLGIDADGNNLLKRTVVMQDGTIAQDDAIVADRLGGLPAWPWF